MTAETRLEWIIRHRGEPVVDIYLRTESAKLDAETVEETLCHIWAGFYDAEDPEELLARQISKQCYAMKRERKLADHKEHLRKLAEKRGAVNNA